MRFATISASDPEGESGRANMVAWLLDEGAGDMDALAFNRGLEAHAIQLSFSAGTDHFTVHVKTLSEHLDKAMELLAMALSKPRLDDDAIERVKAQMHRVLRQKEENPSYIAKRELMRQIYGSHPYANMALGDHQGIDTISKADLQDFLSRYITKGNLAMSAVGDVKAETLQALVKKHFTVLPDAFSPSHNLAQAEFLAAGQTEVVRKSQPQTVVMVATKGIARNDPDFYKAYVLNHLLGGGTLTSKLGDEVREKRGLAYYAYTSLTWLDKGHFLSGGFGTRNEQAADALKVMMNTIRTVQAGEITQAELGEAKGYLTGAWPLSLTSNSGLAGILLTMQLDGLGKDYIERRNSYIEAVTLDDVKANGLIQQYHIHS
ncbi:MAG: M16 family metallopeptidase, partial [Rickettsiales bacterium]